MKMIKELLYVDKSKYKRECDYLINKIAGWAVFLIILCFAVGVVICFVKADYSITVEDTKNLSIPTFVVSFLNFIFSGVISLWVYNKVIKRLGILEALESVDSPRRIPFNKKMVHEMIISLVTFSGLTLLLFSFKGMSAYLGGFVFVNICIFGFILCCCFVVWANGLTCLIRLKYLRLKKKHCKIIKDEK
jgi:hypothetical protein